MFNLGSMYARGRGVAQSDAEALTWYTRAAEKKNAPAMNNLGEMYANGRGVAADEAKAVEWYTRAADAGSAEAMCNLALAYAQAKGIARDLPEAHFWASLAAASGSGDPRTRGEQLAKRLAAQIPAEKVAESRARVTKWIAARAVPITTN
jgi:TPR repeat protein